MRAVLVTLLLAVALPAMAGSDLDDLGVKVGSSVQIDSAGSARLCPKIACSPGSELARVPAGAKVRVEAKQYERIPIMVVVWYRVTHGGKSGWISEMVTAEAPDKSGLIRRRLALAGGY